MDRDEILAEIRGAAESNGGKPVGRERFLRQTGITEYQIGRHWSRWSDALRDAGFEPNAMNVAYDDDFVMEKLIDLTRRLGHVPTRTEIRLERLSRDSSFPTVNVYSRFGKKNDLVGKALGYRRERSGYEDVAAILEAAYVAPSEADERDDSDSAPGFVYLAQGHRGEYKIGRTNLVDRRLPELGATGPVELTLVHKIETDDPPGVESYWHKRFAESHMRGEWFKLSASDVRAFKRWRRIY